MRYLAIDYGNKRTGLAICDAGETIASPLTVIHGQTDLLTKITDIVEAEKVEAIVLGLPLNMDDSEGPQALLTRKFASRLAAAAAACTPPIDVRLWDERLSSFAADQSLAGHLTRGKRRQRQDALAAANILGDFLANEGPARAARPDDISPA